MRMTFEEPFYPTTFAEATARRLVKVMEEMDKQGDEEFEELMKKYHKKYCLDPALKTCKGFNHKMCEDCEKKKMHKKTVCPQCKGNPISHTKVGHGFDARMQEWMCCRCNGTGEVEEEEQE